MWRKRARTWNQQPSRIVSTGFYRSFRDDYVLGLDSESRFTCRKIFNEDYSMLSMEMRHPTEVRWRGRRDICQTRKR